MSEQSTELSEKGLLAANRHQRRFIAGGGNEQALAQYLHPNFVINGPNNRCGARDQLLRLCEGGAFAQENCQTHIEKTSLAGNVGIVMGSEVVTPVEGGLLADWFGTKPIRRRFTDTYVFEDGRWLLLARQASVVMEARKLSLA